ncbi:MAG TPA: mechanosensitive ion channel domain-containing protein, partial [Geminicoccaceae bacterium]
MTVVRRSFYIRCGLIGLLLALSAALAHGQQTPSAIAGSGATVERPSDPLVEEAQLRRLIETLEDPTRRDELLANLRALLAAQEEEPTPAEATPGDALATVVDVIAARSEVIRSVPASIVDAVERLPLVVAWLEAEWRDPDQRALWIEVGVSCLAVFGLGILAYFAALMLLTPIRRKLAVAATRGRLARATRVPLRLLVDLLPVLVFAVAAYLALEAVQPDGIGRLVVISLIDASILAQASIALIRRVFSPGTPELRVPAISDAAARYGARWSTGVICTSVYGYAVLEAAGHLGLPAAIRELLLHLLFFGVAAMIALVVVMIRRPIRAAIESLADEHRSPFLRWLPWRALAGIWHVLALAYLLFVSAVWAFGIPGGFRAMVIDTLASAAVMLGTALVLSVMTRRSQSGVPAGDLALAEAPLLEQRLVRYRSWLSVMGRGLLVLLAGLVLLEIWGVGVLSWLGSNAGKVVLGRLATVALVVIVTLVVWEGINFAIERTVTERDAEGNLLLGSRTRTLLNMTRQFVLVFLGLIALFLVLAELGVNIAPLLAGAGVLGLAIGFGSQKLVQDIITGMFVLLGDSMRIGDVVEVATRIGVVEQMTMRTVVLREYGGNVHTIPYSAIDTVTNYTKDFSYAVFEVGVAYRENVDQVMEAMREIGAEMHRDDYFRRLILEPLDIAGVDRFADSAVIIKARFKTRPLKQWEVSREFNRRVKNRFDEL